MISESDFANASISGKTKKVQLINRNQIKLRIENMFLSVVIYIFRRVWILYEFRPLKRLLHSTCTNMEVKRERGIFKKWGGSITITVFQFISQLLRKSHYKQNIHMRPKLWHQILNFILESCAEWNDSYGEKPLLNIQMGNICEGSIYFFIGKTTVISQSRYILGVFYNSRQIISILATAIFQLKFEVWNSLEIGLNKEKDSFMLKKSLKLSSTRTWTPRTGGGYYVEDKVLKHDVF